MTAELVDFKPEELQEQNKRQLSVIRALSLDQEEQGARLKEQYQAEVDKIKREAREALDDLESRKQKTQTMVEAIVRQRDMYKALYAGGGAGDAVAVADADAAALSLAAAASASLGGGGGGGGGGDSAARLAAVNAELQTQLEKLKEESAANADVLRAQADDHRAAAVEAKAARSTRTPPPRSASPSLRRLCASRRRAWTPPRTARRRRRRRRAAPRASAACSRRLSAAPRRRRHARPRRRTSSRRLATPRSP